MPRIHTLSDIVFATVPDMGITSSGNGTAVDTNGYSSALFTLSASTNGSGTVSAVLQESADGSTNWTNVGSMTGIPISSTKAAATTSVNLKNRLRYLRVVYTITATVSAGCNCNVELTNPQAWPVTQTLGTTYL